MKSRAALLPVGIFSALVLAFIACSPKSTAASATVTPKRTQPYIIGADISWIPNDEAQGAEYYDKGVKKDIFQILKDHHFNYVRLGVIVETPKTNLDAGLNLAQVKAMAKRAKDAGFGILIDFMYGDTWTSPEGQPKPVTWGNLTLPDMATALHDHTETVLAALKEQGTTPDMVQIGNEVTFGMLWPEGRVTSKISTGNPDTDAHNANVTNAGGWDNFAALLKAGIAATHEVDPNIKIMLHHSLGRNDALVHEWVDKLQARGVRFDVVGLSCYQEHNSNDWKTTFDDIAKNYPSLGVIAVEYSEKKRYVNDLVFNTPQNKGLGAFIWEPTRSHETIFDHKAATPAPGAHASNGGRYDVNSLMDLYPAMAKDYGNP